MTTSERRVGKEPVMGDRRGNQEGSFRQRSNGLWEARFSLNGQQVSVYAKTRPEVVRKMRARIDQADRGIPASDERITVERFLQMWLEESARPTVRDTTYEAYAGHVRNHLTPTLGRHKLAKLEPSHVQAMMNDQLAAGLSPTTVNRIRATLRRALNRALKWGMVSRNVATLVDAPKPNRYRVEAITPEEAIAIVAAVEDHRLGALYILMLAVGLRLGEALGLSWDDVNLDERIVTVRRSLQRLNGEFRLTEPKSEQSRRTIPMPDFLVARLRQHRVAQNRERLQAGDAWDREWNLVFTTAKGRPIDNSGVNHTLKRLLKAANLRPMRVHDLRHGCASLLLAKGVTPRVLMETLGHSQISLTMNTYAHVIPSLQRDAADRMDEVFGVTHDA